MSIDYPAYRRAVGQLMAAGQENALKAFYQAATRVPAYKDFLSKNEVDPMSVKTFEDFTKIPPTTKDNYLRQYPLPDLMWDGNEFNGDIISVSSGSTGEPFFWLRDEKQQEEAGDFFYDMYKNCFNCDEIPTLLVVCFSMGIWIAGSYTTLGGIVANRRGLKINIINPALDIEDALAVIKRLQGKYQQIILAGYPPFLKDLLDKGHEEGVDWLKLNVGFTPAGEVIGEELRDYFLKKGTSSKDPAKIISIYGTVDAGIVAYESPLSVNIRRSIYKKGLQEHYFGGKVLPSFAQYDPTRRYIEVEDGNIVFTVSTGIPLIRYNIKDIGGVFTDLEPLISGHGILDELLGKDIDIKKWARPFVYIHGRSDFTVSLYAVLIYPENIKKALLTEELVDYTTGRFVMSVKYRRNLNQYLEIVVELKGGIKPNRKTLKSVEKAITATLLSDNSEYRKLRSSIGKKAHPEIRLKKAGDTGYFARTANKQRWTNQSLKGR